ncbi:serine/threonine protein kinase [Desulfatibacillum aliphaticivorans]|uniref:non-specific serine/threonine protein kinase n=1 Tax=Desulfatibacillum aliphaticivorans TaxID=218208 RepID=B8FGQ3_DESAL|nr:serine/threonine-protein kinase [Desulfatibacillum aliphaticivorans]ACL05283.1 serine/threonine protein kinase [Desulfatibacillum aliphaticivorans]
MDDIQALSQSGRYLNPRLLGSGATANVYAARNLKTGRDVAVKILHPSLARDAANLEQFKREIQIARLVKHPGMVPVYNMMRLKGRVCMEMELLRGMTLKQYLHSQGRLSLSLAAKIGTKIAGILQACHKNNVIHRDLKPQNIFLTKDGRVRILDFGIAKMTAVNDLTKTGVSLGTPEYMAPELFAGSSSDPRTDLYSLGIILFEMIAGRPPFQGDSIAELFTTHLRTPVPNLQEYNPQTPVWLKEAVNKLLEKNPVNRYQCVEEFLLDCKTRNVAANALPSLNKAPCIHCGNETIKNLPFCVFCGFGFSQASRDGRFRLVRNVGHRNFRIPKSEKRELLSFINETFDLDLKKIPAHRKVLLTGVDKMFAELVQKKAERKNIFLQVHEISGVKDSTTEALRLTTFLLPILYLILFLRYFVLLIFEVTTRASSLQFILPLIVAVAAGALVFAISASIIVRSSLEPILKHKDIFSKDLFQDAKWLRNVSDALQKPRTDEMRLTLAQSIERILLLKENAGDVPGQGLEMEKMKELILISARVANLASEVDNVLTQIDWHGLDAERLTDKALKGEMFYMDLLVQYQDLQEKRDSLMARFNELRFTLNRLCSQTLVLKMELERDVLEEYESGLKSLEKELGALAEVRLEVTSLV